MCVWVGVQYTVEVLDVLRVYVVAITARSEVNSPGMPSDTLLPHIIHECVIVAHTVNIQEENTFHRTRGVHPLVMYHSTRTVILSVVLVLLASFLWAALMLDSSSDWEEASDYDDDSSVWVSTGSRRYQSGQPKAKSSPGRSQSTTQKGSSTTSSGSRK